MGISGRFIESWIFVLCTLYVVSQVQRSKIQDPRPCLLFVAELIPDSPDGKDHLRILGILFDLGAQAIDV